MNHQERDELRAKHRPIHSDWFDEVDNEYCQWCEIVYPCDAIRILDTWEASEIEIHKAGYDAGWEDAQETYMTDTDEQYSGRSLGFVSEVLTSQGGPAIKSVEDLLPDCVHYLVTSTESIKGGQVRQFCLHCGEEL
jgi:hypothetical protein